LTTILKNIKLFAQGTASIETPLYRGHQKKNRKISFDIRQERL
jgi:hypothetical protein